jgi:hypothetical protein
MSFLGCCGPDISPDITIYFRLLHNQGGRLKIVSTVGHVVCVQVGSKPVQERIHTISAHSNPNIP